MLWRPPPSQSQYPSVSVPQLDARQLNRRLLDLFSPSSSIMNGGRIDVAALRQFVTTHEPQLDHIHVLTLLHRCARERVPVPQVIGWAKVAEILDRTPAAAFDSQSIGSCLYSMQHYTDDEDCDLACMYQVVAAKIEQAAALGRAPVLNAQAIGNALYGLQKWTGKSIASKRLMGTLTLLLRRSVAARLEQGSPPLLLSAQELGSALWGLRGLSSEDSSVRELVAALADCIAISERSDLGAEPIAALSTPPLRLESQNVGMALLGMRGLSSHHAETRRLLAALLPRLRASFLPSPGAGAGAEAEAGLVLDAQAAGNALSGLRQQRTDEPLVQELVTLLAVGLRGTRHKPLGEQELAMAMGGLQSMHARGAAGSSVRKLLGVLMARARDAHSSETGLELSPRGLAAAVHGLKSMAHEDGPEVAEVAVMLAGMAVVSRERVGACFEVFSAQSLAMFATGLRGLSGESQGGGLDALLGAATPWVCGPTAGAVEALSGAEVGMVLAGLRRMHEGMPSAPAFLQALARRLAVVPDASTDTEAVAVAMSGSDASAALGGLGGLRGDSTASRELLAAAAARMDPALAMTSGEACVALYGLRGFLGSPPEIDGDGARHRELLTSLVCRLTGQITASADGQNGGAIVDKDPGVDFSGHSFGLAALALARALDGGSVPAGEVLAAFAELLQRLEQRTLALEPAAISMSLVALRALRTRSRSRDGTAQSQRQSQSQSQSQSHDNGRGQGQGQGQGQSQSEEEQEEEEGASLQQRLALLIGDSIDEQPSALGGRELAACLNQLRYAGIRAGGRVDKDAGVRAVLAALARNADKDEGKALIQSGKGSGSSSVHSSSDNDFAGGLASPPLTSSQAKSASASLAALDPTVEEVRLLLAGMARRMRRLTGMEILGSKACFVPIAPLLLGFFLVKDQLGVFWRLTELV